MECNLNDPESFLLLSISSYVSLTAESFLGTETTEEQLGKVCVRIGRVGLSPYEVTLSVFVVPHLPP